MLVAIKPHFANLFLVFLVLFDCVFPYNVCNSYVFEMEFFHERKHKGILIYYKIPEKRKKNEQN